MDASGSGQLGDGTTTQSSTPAKVSHLSTGGAATYALLSGGSVRASGSNGHGPLGDGTTTQHNSPVAVQGVASVTDLGRGNTSTSIFPSR